MLRPIRYWISFARSNFASPTPFVIVQLMLWNRGSLETSASAIFVRCTLDTRTCATFRPGTLTFIVTTPLELPSWSGFGLKSVIAAYDDAGVHGCGSEAFGMPSPS